MRGAFALTLAALISSCSDDKTPTVAAPRDERANLGGDVIARVSAAGANEAVPTSLVSKTAIELKIEPAEAARRLVDDAVAAVAARERGLDAKLPTTWNLRAARGRMTIERLRTQARAAGPPTDEEIKELTVRHWREVDRPESARVVHVVVMRWNPPESSAKQDPALDAKAKEFAARAPAPHPGAQSPTESRAYTNRPLNPKGETWLYGKTPKFELPEDAALPGTSFWSG